MNSTVLHAFSGGCLIGLAAIVLLLADGKLAGISGLLGGLLRQPERANFWRVSFLGGLFAGGLVARAMGWTIFSPLPNRSMLDLVIAGLLVGFGTQLGSGCTSGHGVCGIGRFSIRSIVATLVFMAAGALTVYSLNHMRTIAP